MEFDSRTVLRPHGAAVVGLGSTAQSENAWLRPPHADHDGSMWSHEGEARVQSPANNLDNESFSPLGDGNDGLFSFRSHLSTHDRRERNVAVYQTKRGLLRSSSAPKHCEMLAESIARSGDIITQPGGFESNSFQEVLQCDKKENSQMFLSGESLSDQHGTCSQAPCAQCSQQLHSASMSSRSDWLEREHSQIRTSWSWSPVTDNKTNAYTPTHMYCSRQGGGAASADSCVEHVDCKLDCRDAIVRCNFNGCTFHESFETDRHTPQPPHPYAADAFWGVDGPWSQKESVPKILLREQNMPLHSTSPLVQQHTAPPVASPLASRSDSWAKVAVRADIEVPYTSFSKLSLRKPPLQRTFGSAGQKHWGGRHAYNSGSALRATSSGWSGASASAAAVVEMRSAQLNKSRGMNVETRYEGKPQYAGEKRFSRGVSCDENGKGGCGGERRTNEMGTASFNNRSTGTVSIADLDTLQEELETAPLKRLDRSKQIRKQWTLVQMEYDLNAQKFTMKNLEALSATPSALCEPTRPGTNGNGA